MAPSPTATLTYGYDIDPPDTDWANNDEPDEEAADLLAGAGLPSHIGVHQDRSDAYGGLRLHAAFLQSSGYRDKGVTNSLELPEDCDNDLRRAATVLGVDLGNATPYWLLTGEVS